jgi:PhnB protein
VTGLTPYLTLPGTAREALLFYAEVFGGSAALHSFADFGRTDGPADAIAHGYLVDSPVELFAADLSGDELPFHSEGLLLSLLGTADPTTLRAWFAALSVGGKVVDELQQRAWGDFDGQVIDRFGLHWLIGYEADA